MAMLLPSDPPSWAEDSEGVAQPPPPARRVGPRAAAIGLAALGALALLRAGPPAAAGAARPGDVVGLAAAAQNSTEPAGSLTMSLSLQNVGYDAVIGHVPEVVSAVKQAVVVGVGTGMLEAQVGVVLQRSADFNPALPSLPAASLANISEEFSDELVVTAPAARPAAAATATAATADPGTTEAAPQTEMAEMVPQEWRRLAAVRQSPRAAHKSFAAALGAAAKQSDPGFSATGRDAVHLQVTVGGCGSHCAADRTALLGAAFRRALAARVDAALSVGGVSVAFVASPAAPTTCLGVVCEDVSMVAAHPETRCLGADCQRQCCVPRTCAQVSCESPLQRVVGAALLHKCTSYEDCADTCCLQSCQDVECDGSAGCLRKDAWTVKARPSQAQATCCNAPAPVCCTAKTAWCAACQKCQSLEAYCESAVMKWTPAAVAPRRLRGEGVPALADERLLLIDKLVAGSGNVSFAELESSLLEAAASLHRLQHPEVEARRLAAPAGAGAALLADAIRAAKAAAPLGPATSAAPTRRGPSEEALRKAAAAAALKGKSIIPGCEAPIVPGRCPFYLQSIFRAGGHGRRAAMNTVAVLPDTIHAVTCGDDGVCWVFDICTGFPVQCLVPDGWAAGKPRPVRSVTTICDSTHIVSAGDAAIGGVAHVWNWREGRHEASLRCGGAFLSSSDDLSARSAILGCADGSATVWNWNSGERVVARMATGHVARFLEGTEDSVFNANESHPVIARALGLVHASLGAVTSVAYTPTSPGHFVTGSADGKVRLWDAGSGTLVRCMMGRHSGRVNAVAAFPDLFKAASGGDDGVINMWDLTSGLLLRRFEQLYAGPVLSLQVVPGGRAFFAGSQDGYVRIWSTESFLLLCGIQTGGGPVRGLALNPSNPMNQVITANEDGLVRVFAPR